MRLTWTRRISQGFFLLLFVWFSLAASLGEAWWQLRGWPVNWFQELDPLMSLGVLLGTGTLHGGMWWSLVTIGLTLILGRFFCGWVCPFGTLHHLIGWLAGRRAGRKERIRLNRPRKARNLKYYILLAMLASASGGLGARLISLDFSTGPGNWVIPAIGVLCLLALMAWTLRAVSPKRLAWGLIWAGLWLMLSAVIFTPREIGASLQSGLLDPLPLLHRSFNLVLLPLFEPAGLGFNPAIYWSSGAWLVAAVFAAALLLNLISPRFYCRFVCPLGALFGILARVAPLRIGKSLEPCIDCGRCDVACQGASSPSGSLQSGECLLCMNCRQACPAGLIQYSPAPSAAGEDRSLDLGRRKLVLTMFGGLALPPVLRLGGMGTVTPPPLRPPGSLSEAEFLARCTKCGMCMRICPTGVIQPSLTESGLEGLWTPVMDFRLSRGGCLKDCVGCGHLCPTAAIRPLSLDERQGRGAYAEQGPVRIGTAFFDRSRCLPWAMDRPCIVCQEMCPVSPKAIFTRTEFKPVREGRGRVVSYDRPLLKLSGVRLKPGQLAGGDYFLSLAESLEYFDIADNGPDWLKLPGTLDGSEPVPGGMVTIMVRLQKPQVDPAMCIGCGACEQACPVGATPAIRVSPENATRGGAGTLLAGQR